MADEEDDIRPDVAREIESISSNFDEGGRQNKTFSLQFLVPTLNETEMVGISKALRQSNQVEQVSLLGCLIGSPFTATSTFIKKMLETHSTITEINLSGNCLNNNLAEVIGLALKTNTNLKELWLSATRIEAAGAIALAEGLRHNKTLQILALGYNKVDDRGTIAFAEVLRINKTLQGLHLYCNGVTLTGAKVLASALEKASLKELHLSGKNTNGEGLNDEGGKAIAESLLKNKSLTRLHLINTGLGDETCKALAAALCNNSSLEQLHLDGNEGITTVGAGAFEETLKHMNYSLEHINFNHENGVPHDQRSRIRNLCVNNVRVNTFFQQVNQNIPLGVWPKVLEAVECKPDLLFSLLKANPEVCTS